MKKIMLSGLISVAVMQAKLFVGIDGGYDLGYFKTVSHNSYLLGSTAFENTRDSNFYAGLNIGHNISLEIILDCDGLSVQVISDLLKLLNSI